MITIVKLIIGFFLSLMTQSNDRYESINEYAVFTAPTFVRAIPITSKEKTFQILENKCNVCHSKRNRRGVFTLDNMDSLAKDVYKQVFIKKRMPKGNKIKLTSQEYQDLLTWISTTKNQ